MTDSPYLRTKDLAEAVHVSVQQVRNYEADGFIPPVERSPSGYRRYTRRHLAALKTARLLIGGYGRERARQIMQAVHQDRLPEALGRVDKRHPPLTTPRREQLQTLATLSLLATQLPSDMPTRFTQGLRVGAAAHLVGVRVSALRFWEQQGLLQPSREDDSKYRRYDERQLRRLHIVALLRQANYDFAAIRTTLAEIEAGQPQRAIAAVEQRRGALASRSWRCLRAMALFYAYTSEFLDGADIM